MSKYDESQVNLANVLAACDVINEQVMREIITPDMALVWAVNNLTRAVVRVAEEMDNISWRTIATPDLT